MATVIGAASPNVWGAALGGALGTGAEMKFAQQNWQAFLDWFQENFSEKGGVDISGATQENPMAVYGAPPEYGGGQEPTYQNQVPPRPTPFNPLQSIGRGIGSIGRGIGGMLGMNRPQTNALAGNPVAQMFQPGAQSPERVAPTWLSGVAGLPPRIAATVPQPQMTQGTMPMNPMLLAAMMPGMMPGAMPGMPINPMQLMMMQMMQSYNSTNPAILRR